MSFKLIHCDICNNDFKTNVFAKHLMQCHNLTTEQYALQYRITKCIRCGINDALLSKAIAHRLFSHNSACQPYCKSCKTAVYSERWSAEMRHNMQQKRVEWLLHNKHCNNNAWHNRANRHMSYLEQQFVDRIVKRNWHKLYCIVNELYVKPYFIDFAFVDYKLAIEVDGKCHFCHGQRIEHDIHRDKQLAAQGWHILRLEYQDVMQDTTYDIIEQLLQTSEYSIETAQAGIVSYRHYVQSCNVQFTNNKHIIRCMSIECSIITCIELLHSSTFNTRKYVSAQLKDAWHMQTVGNVKRKMLAYMPELAATLYTHKYRVYKKIA